MLSVADYQAQPAAPPDERVSYGPLPDQFADLYLPSGAGPHPAILLIHGGCWRAQYGLEPLGLLCLALRDAGLAVWSVEYRRLGSGGGWPTTFLDVAAAADSLRGLGDRCGIDLGRVIAAGHSAGGQLALWLAARSRLPPGSALFQPKPLGLRGVLALAALADLAEGARRGLCGGACAELLGGAPEAQPERYAQASPAALLPLGLPQRHIAGALDPVVPADYLASYVAAASAAGDNASLELLPNAGHFEPVAGHGPAWEIVRAAALDLLT